MISVEDRGDELYVVDAEKNEITIGLTDWEPGGSPREIDRRVDETLVGQVSELRFPEAAVCIESESEEHWKVFGDEVGPLELEVDKHLVQIEANITVYIRFDGSAIIRRITRGKDVIVDFQGLSTLTLGLKSRVQVPAGEITVKPTIEGIAAGISHLSAAIETTAPDRSYPSLRGYPPLLRFGEERDISDSIQEDTAGTDIRIRLPEDLTHVLVASPLVYYLQSTIDIRKDIEPRLVIPSLDFVHTLDELPSFQFEVANLLRRVFFLDCLVREVGPYKGEIEGFSLLSDIGLDASSLYSATPENRLIRYLEADFEEIDPELPEWHLSTFIEPEVGYTTAIPHLLNRLSLIFPPKGTPLDRRNILEQSLVDDVRSEQTGRGMSCDQPIKPTARPGWVHGWMADGAPINAFKIIPKAFANRFKYLGENSGQKKVTVVLNDLTMDEEQTLVEDIYQNRAKELSIEVEIKEELSKGELIEVFEKPRDFVHYIGHCDDGGFRCSDGVLSIRKLEESNVRTFFLNACGSYEEGIELLRKGSVAGAVTLQRVLDQQATQVGTAFARLIINGFSVEQALRLARCEAVMSKAYIAVGDGTYTLSQFEDKYPMYISIDTDSEILESTSKMASQCGFGAIYQSYLNNGNKYLIGRQDTVEIDNDELMDYLSKTNGPVVYDREVVWSSELFERLKQSETPL